MTFQAIGSKTDVPVGSVRVFEIDGVSVCVGNIDDETFYAIDNVCTHDGGPLGEGTLIEGMVECPRHGARFDLKTGAVRALPAVRAVRTYPVQIEAGEVRVDVG